MKLLTSLLLFLVYSTSAFSASTVSGYYDEAADEVIVTILDDSSSSPFDAAWLMRHLKDQSQSVIITNPRLNLNCKSLQPAHGEAFGSCELILKQKVVDQRTHYGMLVSGPEALALLDYFKGNENPDFLQTRNIEMASGNLSMTADHARKLFAIRISKSLLTP